MQGEHGTMQSSVSSVLRLCFVFCVDDDDHMMFGSPRLRRGGLSGRLPGLFWNIESGRAKACDIAYVQMRMGAQSSQWALRDAALPAPCILKELQVTVAV